MSCRYSILALGVLLSTLCLPAQAAEEPFLGLLLDPNLPPGRGQPIAEVSPGGPAEAAGIRPADLLLSVDGFPIRRPTDVGRALQGTRPGDLVRVDVERRGRLLKFNLRLGDREAETDDDDFHPQNEPAELPPPDAYLGVVTISPTERDLEQLNIPARFTRGALVLRVLRGSPAAEAGLARSDLIVGFDGQSVDSPAELQRRTTQAGAGADAKLQFARGAAVREVKLRLTDPKRFVEPPEESPVDWTVEERLDAIERHLRRMDERMTRIEIAIDRLSEERRPRPLPRQQ